jgi:hypothetical protein
MPRLLVASLVLALLLSPSAALAQQQAQPAPQQPQQGPFAPLPPPAPEPAPPPEEPEDPLGEDVGRTTLYIIAAALLLAFIGIGVYISRDARKSLPAEARASQPRLRDDGPHRRERRAKSRARAKGRAQRAARRRNR